jgi:glycosyltransferase involved in cell wall biosynthesis
MKVLLVHNFYGSTSPSGENAVVVAERDLLRAAGHEVSEFFVYSDWIREGGVGRLLWTGMLAPWNPFARSRLRRRIREDAPDVVHIHNVFPLLSPAVFSAADARGPAVVSTLHNYRTLCAAGLLLRRGKPCDECVGRKSALPAIRHGCYKDSRVMTLPVAAGISLHRRLLTYDKHVDAHIALTEFQKQQLVRGGLPAHKIHVKPNWCAADAQPLPWNQREPKVVFVGRVSAEKGVDNLLEAWRRWGAEAPKLEVIGDGPDLERLRTSANGELSGKVTFTGRMSQQEAHASLSRARLMVLPSVWPEGLPLVLREAFAFGVPVAASRLGALEELVEKPGGGRCFNAGDPQHLLQTVAQLWSDQTALERMGHRAFSEHQTRFNSTEALAGLERIYRWAMEARRRRW